jgi:hypothetical protein
LGDRPGEATERSLRRIVKADGDWTASDLVRLGDALERLRELLGARGAELIEEFAAF